MHIVLNIFQHKYQYQLHAVIVYPFANLGKFAFSTHMDKPKSTSRNVLNSAASTLFETSGHRIKYIYSTFRDLFSFQPLKQRY